ncbi:deoxyribonuclease IV [Nonomuraea maheshkhaliensis]|uniref:Deoxyribonuclease IV n=1 Tax=Nonomuraea maheshkhaliensis TaxID=419590 RepID=A0ABP4QQ54_9ACTN
MVQFFLGDPQGYDKPVLPEQPVEGVDIYIHAPYLVNVATTNNRIRIPSRKLLEQHLKAAAGLGAKGLIVHGGHVNKSDDPQAGFDNWRKVFERMECPIPVLIENTAGGGNAMARKLDRIARLWEALDGFDVGFCLDTCHAHAGGEELVDVVERVKAITGRIDLVHCNDSRDDFDSGADRHANLGQGKIDPELILAVCRAAGAPIVVETPAEGQADDIAFLRKNL